MSAKQWDEETDIPLQEFVSRVWSEGSGNHIIGLGDKRYYRHELMSAFGGPLHLQNSNKNEPTIFGNPTPLGLSSYGLSAFVLGLYLTGAAGITVPNVVVGLCFFYGGVVQAAVGIWEMILGNTFAGTVFVSFGMGFWMSFGSIYVEAFGIVAAYGDDTKQFNDAVGFYLLGWGLFTSLMFLCTVKTTVPFMGLFLFLGIAFFVLAGYYFTGIPSMLSCGGVFVIISALCSWYCAFAEVATVENSYITTTPIKLPVYERSML